MCVCVDSKMDKYVFLYMSFFPKKHFLYVNLFDLGKPPKFSIYLSRNSQYHKLLHCVYGKKNIVLFQFLLITSRTFRQGLKNKIFQFDPKC